MEKEDQLQESSTPCLHLVSAFLACESPDFVISFAREFGGGSITERVQRFIWTECINKSDVKCNLPYLKRFLKKLIVEIESNGDVVLDELYEKYIYCLASVKDDELAKGSTRMLRRFSFLFPKDCSQASSCEIFRKLEVTLQCSLNMLEGDTGCSIWPSGLFLSEFVLSFPEVFLDKSCLEVGSGVGLVGVCLAQANCSKVTLTDGDLSTLANMKLNLELNQLATDMLGHTQKTNTLQCLYLPWESATENELREFMPDIVNLWSQLQDNIRYKVGNRTRVLFWKDHWIDQGSLMSCYPDIYVLSSLPDAMVNEVWSEQGWNLSFRRLLNDWEIGRVAEMIQTLDDFKGTSLEEDAMIWKYNQNGILSVNRLYKRKVKELPGEISGPWRKIWKNKVPTKVRCFTWLVARRTCLTHEKLQRRGFQIASWCSLCNETYETNNYLFLHCNFTTQLWAIFLRRTNTSWTMPEHTADLLSCWVRRGGSKSQKKWWSMIPSCIWWTIWRERNKRCMENTAESVQKTKWLCMKTFFFWCKEEGIEDAGQILDFFSYL